MKTFNTMNSLTPLTQPQLDKIELKLSVCIQALSGIYTVSSKYYKRLDKSKKDNDAISNFFHHMYNYFLEVPQKVTTPEQFSTMQQELKNYTSIKFPPIEVCIENSNGANCALSFGELIDVAATFPNSPDWKKQAMHKFLETDVDNIMKLQSYHAGFHLDNKSKNLKNSIQVFINLESSNVDHIKSILGQNLFLKCQNYARMLADTNQAEALDLFTAAKQLQSD